MEWLLFALAGYFFYALTNIISKVIVTKRIKDIYVYSFMASLFGLIPLLLVPFFGFTLPGVTHIIASLIAGALWLYALVPYYKALQVEEVSRVIPVWRLNPLFTLMFAFLLVGEVLGRNGGTFRLSRAFCLMLLSTLLFAVSHAISKFVYVSVPYIDGFILIRLGSVLAGTAFLFLPGRMRSISRTWGGMGSSVKCALLAYAALQFLALASINFAFTGGPVSLVVSFGGFQSLFVLVLASLVSFRLPGLLKEELGKGAMLQKAVAILMLFLGSALVLLF
jgi:uncharacterized membrane protein